MYSSSNPPSRSLHVGVVAVVNHVRRSIHVGLRKIYKGILLVVLLLLNASPNRCGNDETRIVNEDTRGGGGEEEDVRRQQRMDSDDNEFGDDDTSNQRRRVRRCQPRIYVSLASAMAALGGVLFGYDTGNNKYARISRYRRIHESIRVTDTYRL